MKNENPQNSLLLPLRSHLKINFVNFSCVDGKFFFNSPTIIRLVYLLEYWSLTLTVPFSVWLYHGLSHSLHCSFSCALYCGLSHTMHHDLHNSLLYSVYHVLHHCFSHALHHGPHLVLQTLLLCAPRPVPPHCVPDCAPRPTPWPLPCSALQPLPRPLQVVVSEEIIQRARSSFTACKIHLFSSLNYYRLEYTSS